MSIEIVKKEIDKFLKSSTPEVLAIKGEWGVGKTFAWNRYIEEAKNENRIALGKYSYVSLFGCNSLETFKFSIFEQVINKDLIGASPGLETFNESAGDALISFGRKFSHLFKNVPYIKNVTPALESIAFLSLKETLICIDDLERKGRDLDIKDVLGLATVLKEQKKCKIVIILNDDSLGGMDQDDLKRFKEKVIDIEILFSPSPEECSEIAISGDDEVSENLRKLSTTLRINNIRIIKRNERIARILQEHLSKYEEEVLYQALHSLVLYSWCYFAGGEKVPSHEWVKKIGFEMFGLEKTAEDPQKTSWVSVLQKYDYQTTNEFDLVIFKSVETGYIDEKELHAEAEKINQQIIASKSENSFREAWDLYHHSFDDNQDGFCDKLYESFKKNFKYIDPTGLDASVRILRELGRGTEADELIEFYMENRKETPELFDLKEYHFASDIKDKNVIYNFNKFRENTEDRESLHEVVSRIAGKDGWGRKDVEVLKKATVDEYYELFKNEDGGHLSAWVNTCLQFGRFSNASDEDMQIFNTAKGALIKIGRESKINARRVSKFGIEVKDEDIGN